MNNRKRHHGYVLALTLVLVVIAGLALAGASRMSLQHAVESQARARELQRRWGMLSAQAVLLPNSEQILVACEVQARQPMASCRQGLRLGDQDFDFVFADEQAKASASAMVQRLGKDQTRQVLSELVPGMPIDLRDSPASFGQVFDQLLPKDLLEQTSGTITCWGPGTINYLRAPEAVLSKVCSPPLSLTQVHQLVALRQQWPPVALSAALDQLNLDGDVRGKAQALLTDASTCHSLWIVCRDDRRSWYRLAVSEGKDQMSCFEW
jgi:hypothetical protein